MARFFCTVARLAILSLPLAASANLLAGDGPWLEVRTLTPLTTKRAAKTGPARRTARGAFAPVRAVVLGASSSSWNTAADATPLVPIGALLHGHVEVRKSVGLSLRRERASLGLRFTHWQDSSGQWHPLVARLTKVDNAREQVDRHGRIQGILAAHNPMGVLRGFWFRPALRQSWLGPIGLSGPTGLAWSRLALGPIGGLGIFVAKCAFTRLPDPEIDLPPGTELTLQIENLPSEKPTTEIPALENPNPEPANSNRPPPSSFLSAELAAHLAALPVTVLRANGEPAADLINLALFGTRQQVEAAFASSGWQTADPLSGASFGKMYRAWTRRHGYPHAPFTDLWYEGRLPDLVFQKSLNSLAKRHHIRLWRATLPATLPTHTLPLSSSSTGDSSPTLWLAAATHDVTIMREPGTLALTHRIDPYIDPEREKVLRDLAFSGAVAQQLRLPRQLPRSAQHPNPQPASTQPTTEPGIPEQAIPAQAVTAPSITAQAVTDKDITDQALTDQALAVALLQTPAPEADPAASLRRFPSPRNQDAPSAAPLPPPALLARRLLLEARQHLLRENPYFLATHAARLLWRRPTPQSASIRQPIATQPSSRSLPPRTLPTE